MAQITLTMSNADRARIVAAVTVRFGYQAQIDGAPNPQPAAEFVKARIGEWLCQQTCDHEHAELKAAVPSPSPVVIT